jgi:hypothetical protein
MPTLSASDYTRYLKLRTAATAYQSGNAPKKIQTVDQAAPLVSILNANIFTSQASYVLNPTLTQIQGNARVQPVQPSRSNNPNALSTLGYAGTSGALGPSALQRPGGLPANNVVGTYTRLPQNAGW